MAKKVMEESSCSSCSTSKCLRWWGMLITLIGLLYLGKDLGWFNWWNVNWWTVAFLLIGLCKLCWSYMKECEC